MMLSVMGYYLQVAERNGVPFLLNLPPPVRQANPESALVRPAGLIGFRRRYIIPCGILTNGAIGGKTVREHRHARPNFDQPIGGETIGITRVKCWDYFLFQDVV